MRLTAGAAAQRVLVAAAAYFAAVFAAGFVLGVLRTLVVAPTLGDLAAVAVELPLILACSWVVCGHVLRRWPPAPAAALAMGGMAFALLMAVETLLSTQLAARSLAAHWALYAEPAHRLGLAGQIMFALMPRAQSGRPR